MNKNSNKSKLSKKLKFISVASAITICAVSSTGGTEVSASIFRNGWNRFVNLFSRSSTPTTTSSGKLNRPSSDARTSTTTTGGSGSVWGRIKSAFGSSGSTTKTGGLKTTDLDTESTSSGTSSNGLWNKFKGLFTRTSGNNATSNKNKSGVTNPSYTPDNDETPTFNPKNDDQNLKNLDYLIKTSKPGSSSTSSGDGVQYVSLDFSGKTSGNTVHGSGEGVIYAAIKPTTVGTTGSTSSSSSSGSGGRRPIPTPRTKNLSGSLQTSSTGLNDGNNGGNITGVLTSKTQGSSGDLQSSSSNSTGRVLVGQGYGFKNEVVGDDLIITVVPPPTPVRPKNLGKTSYTPRGGSNTTSGVSSSSNGATDQAPPRNSVILQGTSTMTIGGSSTSSNTGSNGGAIPKLVTFKSE